jgi:uracil-DNA glycosylase family 4
LTPLQQHTKKWASCRACPLCENRKNVVLWRGTAPADIAFIGEAPGDSEDVFGYPFVGPAGMLLDQICSRALDGKYKLAFANLVACIPKGDDGLKYGEPEPSAIRACESRLIEFIKICKPQLIVRVGSLATKHFVHLNVFTPVPTVCDIVHPAAILRANIASRGFAIQKVIVILRQAAEGLKRSVT